MSEYIDIDDPRDLDGEPDEEVVVQVCIGCGHRTTADISDCPECGGELEIVTEEDPTPWCTACGSMTRTGCYCGLIVDND